MVRTRKASQAEKFARAFLLLAAGLVALVAGCQAPPASLKACKEGGHTPKRSSITMHTVLCDSAVQLATRPVQSTKTMVCQTTTHLTAGVTGGLCRAFGTCILGAPGCLPEDAPTLDPQALEEKLHKRLGSDLKQAQVDLFIDGDKALAALKGVI